MRTEEETRDIESLNYRLAALLSSTANALHGGKLQNGAWSWHDLPELATALRLERDRFKDALRELLKDGEHDGPCMNEVYSAHGQAPRTYACDIHVETAYKRAEAAEKLLEGL